MNENFFVKSFSVRQIIFKILVVFFVTSLVVTPVLAAVPIRGGISNVTRTPVTTVTTTQPIPTTGYLAVESTPSGAQVSVNGVSSGITPLVLSGVSPGSYSVVVSIVGYEPESDMVSVMAGQRTLVSFTLEPISATPPPTTAPVIAQTTKTIMVEQPTKISLQIGNIIVSGSPAGSQVVLDGNQVGSLPAAGKSIILEKIIAGEHTLIISQAGYTSKTTDITVPAGGNVSVTIDLQKVEIATPAQLTPVTPLVTTTPTRRMPTQIIIKGLKFRTVLAPGSPDYLAMAGLTSETPVITTVVQVDSNWSWDDYQYYLDSIGSNKVILQPLIPKWSENAITCLPISDDNAYFRWISDNPQVDGVLWQVSRFPFPSVSAGWKNQDLPGLVGSGLAENLEIDADGFHYFKVNLSRIADRNPGYGPYYEGIASLGKDEWILKLPLGLNIKAKEINIGPVSISIPVGLSSKPEADYSNIMGQCTYCNQYIERNPTPIEKGILELPQTFYFRVIPLAGGKGGTPSLPVEITVTRPDPCPSFAPSSGILDLVVRPPSVEVLYYDPPRFYEDWEGLARSRLRIEDSMHIKQIVPEPKPCKPLDPSTWDTCVEKALGALIGIFETLSNAVSSGWEYLKDKVVDLAAGAVYLITAGGVNCDDPEYGKYCKGVLKTGLNVALVALGVPPTIPNYAEIQNMGKEYLIKTAADQIGAGEAYDMMPPDWKQKLQEKSGEIANKMIPDALEETKNTQQAASGTLVPDPWFAPHPGLMLVRVYNPNQEPTDPAQIRSSIPVYKGFKYTYVPSLKPGEEVFIPLVLDLDIPDEIIEICFNCIYDPSIYSDPAVCSGIGYTTWSSGDCQINYIIQQLQKYDKATVDAIVKAPPNEWNYQPWIPAEYTGEKGAGGGMFKFNLGSPCSVICGVQIQTIKITHPAGWIYTNTPLYQQGGLGFPDCNKLFREHWCNCNPWEECHETYMRLK